MDELSRRQFFRAAGTVAGASLVGTGEGATRQSGGGAPAITLTCSDYLRYTPLATGDVRPRGLDLTWVRGPRSEMLTRALSDPEVHGGETSMLGHLLRVDGGDRSVIAVPVFPLRNFTARDIYVAKGSSLTPSRLKGTRAGIYNWTASGAVWYRHLVRYFNQDPATMKWIVGGTDEPARITARAPLPPYVSDAPSDDSLSDLLLAGEIDAVFAPLPPRRFHPTDGPIVRLMPDFRTVEKRYFAETRCYPPQHVLVIRRGVWETNPAIGPILLETFAECEARFQDGQHLFPYSTPWEIAEVEDTDLLMGRNYHAHGLEENRHVVDVFCQAAFDDGLTKRRLTVEDYFADFLKA